LEKTLRQAPGIQLEIRHVCVISELSINSTHDPELLPMSTKAKSRWADEEEESPEAIAQRKREKEEKRRIKEGKLRRATEVHAPSPGRSDQQTDPFNGESERPAKRRRTSNETGQQRLPSEEHDSKLLQFPTTHFGPCKDVEEYELLNNIEEGSYGMVSRARTKATGEVVALKRLKMEHTSDGFPVTGLREIQTLMASRHNNIVKLREVVMGGTMKE
jgi:cell division cycle 2-like protein